MPLLQLRDTLARLTAGDVEARAAVDPRAPAEVGAVAVSVNALAEEGQRLRRADAERARTGELARELGVRIREHLVVETVLAERSRRWGGLWTPTGHTSGCCATGAWARSPASGTPRTSPRSCPRPGGPARPS
ncbi:MAG: HAMP domain-containing protein [Actinomycetota bacterium]|nr:HAMP domain-containing protein [Actinomycetota bacterium]